MSLCKYKRNYGGGNFHLIKNISYSRRYPALKAIKHKITTQALLILWVANIFTFLLLKYLFCLACCVLMYLRPAWRSSWCRSESSLKRSCHEIWGQVCRVYWIYIIHNICNIQYSIRSFILASLKNLQELWREFSLFFGPVTTSWKLI